MAKPPWDNCQFATNLFLAVLLDVDLHRLFSVASGMNCMAVRRVSVVCRLFVMASVMMLGGFAVMTGRMREVFRSFFVVFSSPFRHVDLSPRLNECPRPVHPINAGDRRGVPVKTARPESSLHSRCTAILAGLRNRHP